MKVGDHILVSVKNTLEESKPVLKKYEVTKVGRKFISAQTIGFYDEKQFSRQSMVHQPSKSKWEWRIWESEEEFNEAVAAGYFKDVTGYITVEKIA